MEGQPRVRELLTSRFTYHQKTLRHFAGQTVYPGRSSYYPHSVFTMPATTDFLLPGLYLALAGAYLLVLPLMLYFYLRARWYVASSVERLLLYFLVFLFFPGLLLWAPFLNFRPRPRSVV